MATVKIERKDIVTKIELTEREAVGLSTLLRNMLTISSVEKLGLSGLCNALRCVPSARNDTTFSISEYIAPEMDSATDKFHKGMTE